MESIVEGSSKEHQDGDALKIRDFNIQYIFCAKYVKKININQRHCCKWTVQTFEIKDYS